jgi:hypothetical protein
MENLNLVFKFKIASDAELQVRCARSLKVDGRGNLIFENAETGSLEMVNLGQLKDFRLQPIAKGWEPLPLAG